MTGAHENKWSSKFGFLMSAIGGAVGLGNIWRFPYIVGQHGGALFLLVYIAIVVILGFPMVSLELTLGRRREATLLTGTFRQGGKNWSFVGIIMVVTCLLMISYYLVIGGWLVKYLGGYLAGGDFVANGSSAEIFHSFVGDKVQSSMFTVIFLLACLSVLIFGIRRGIEKISKILMPLLFVMLVFVMVCSLTLDGAIEGVKFFFVPNFEAMQASGGILGLIESAMGQAFFSLSLGMGVTITYGSYLDKSVSIAKSSIIICLFDSLVAVIAGLAVLPAIFSSGQAPTAGASLLFVALPNVFRSLGVFGIILAVTFFLLVLFASLTSAISVMEVLVSSLMGKAKKLSRAGAVLAVGGVLLLTSISVSLSQSGIFRIDLLELFDLITVKILIPLSAVLLCLYASRIVGKAEVTRELTHEPKRWTKAWGIAIGYVCPALILLIFALGLFGLDFSALIIS